MGNIAARLAAAFNRSTLLVNPSQPDAEVVQTYYGTEPTNHYSKIVHSVNVDGKGYTFPYDDVGPAGGVNQSGSVRDGSPVILTVVLGGTETYIGRISKTGEDDPQMTIGGRDELGLAKSTDSEVLRKSYSLSKMVVSSKL